eukprot:10634882-Ditylum_brightwellii.AAC.1
METSSIFAPFKEDNLVLGDVLSSPSLVSICAVATTEVGTFVVVSIVKSDLFSKEEENGFYAAADSGDVASDKMSPPLLLFKGSISFNYVIFPCKEEDATATITAILIPLLLLISPPIIHLRISTITLFCNINHIYFFTYPLPQ